MSFSFPEKITVWNPAANDGFGGVTWTAPVVYSARIAYRAEKFTDTNGDDQISTAVAYSEGTTLSGRSRVLFGESVELEPPPGADDVRQISQTPSGPGPLKKVWFS